MAKVSKQWVGGLVVGGLLLALHGGVVQAQGLALGARTGATVKPLLGVNLGSGPQGDAGNVDATSLYKQRGVTLIRNHDYGGPLDMATMYPDRSKDPLQKSAYNFTGVLDVTYKRSSDSVFSAILAGGFEPYFRIGDSYSNVTPPSAAELPNWAQAVVQVLKHYREGQWNGFSSSFRFAEIGSEPDNAQFWQAKVRSLLDHVKTNNTPLDFLSFHVYSNDPTTYTTCAQYYRNELDTRGFSNVDLHISEWNTPNGSATSAVGQLRYSGLGAAYLTSAWINLENAGVAQSTFYRGTDPAANSPEFYGMLYGDGRTKKVAEAFSLWRDFAAYGNVLALSGVASGLTALAAEDGTGAPEAFVGNLPPSYSVQPFVGVDVRGTSGIPVFIGYGSSLADMVAATRYKEVYRTP